MLYRQETRWPSYHTRTDYPERNDADWLCFVNSRRDPTTGGISLFTRPHETPTQKTTG
jgi:adenylylsulfate reductase subunit A